MLSTEYQWKCFQAYVTNCDPTTMVTNAGFIPRIYWYRLPAEITFQNNLCSGGFATFIENHFQWLRASPNGIHFLQGKSRSYA